MVSIHPQFMKKEKKNFQMWKIKWICSPQSCFVKSFVLNSQNETATIKKMQLFCIKRLLWLIHDLCRFIWLHVANQDTNFCYLMQFHQKVTCFSHAMSVRNVKDSSWCNMIKISITVSSSNYMNCYKYFFIFISSICF